MFIFLDYMRKTYMTGTDLRELLFKKSQPWIRWYMCDSVVPFFLISCFFISFFIFNILLCSNHLLQFKFITCLLQNETFVIYFGLWLTVCRCWFFINFVVKAFFYLVGFARLFFKKKLSFLELVLCFFFAFCYLVGSTIALLWWSPGIDDLFKAAGYVQPFQWMYYDFLVYAFGYFSDLGNFVPSNYYRTIPSKTLKALVTEGYIPEFLRELQIKTVIKQALVHMEYIGK